MNKHHSISRIVQGLAFVLCMLGGVHQALAQSVDKAPARKDLVLRGDAQCTRCHNESEEYPVLSIGKTKHGTVADSRTPTCTSCHGASETHVNRPGGSAERPKPTVTYGLPAFRNEGAAAIASAKRTETPVADRNAKCLSCHQDGKRVHWQTSLHSGRDVACTSCHQIHTGHDKVRDKKEQAQVCFTCHKEQRAQVSRPSRHPIPEGKVTCSDCHNPHGSAGPKAMVRDTVNDTCYTCHMEKRGPFVRTHQPVQEDCSICHSPHGTTTPNLLKARPPFLCQECHEPTQHRGGAATFFGASPANQTSANLIARGCVNCHTNLHGTNNPINATGERVFRR